jgi:cytosine/creatinine deaminase
MVDTIYRNLRQPDGTFVDLSIADGRIVAMGPTGWAESGRAQVVDGNGQLLLPALVESHVHIDKTLWGLPWRPHSAGPSLKDLIANERRVLREVNVPIAGRAGALLETCIAHGSLHIRSHIDVDPEIGLRHVEALLALREAYRDVVEMQFVVFPQMGMLIRPGTAELMERALEMGVETVGGLDPAGIDNDPIRHLETIFDLAGKHGRGVDIHLHDGGELGVWQIERIADFTQASGLAGKVMISHAFCLGMVPTTRIEALGGRLAELRISLMTTAPADISVPPVAFLKALGVNICCGSDGIRDAWSPYGNGDMLERAMLLSQRFDWRKDEELASAFDSATIAGARALGLTGYGLAPGHAANFILLPAENLSDALARRPQQRTVVSRGMVIARDGHFLEPRQG